MSWRGLAKRDRSPRSPTSVAALTSAMPRIVCSAATTGASVQSGSIASICAVSPIAPRRGGFDCRNVVLEHDMMHRLLELEPCEPAAMQLGPCWPPVMAALAQQEPRELLTRAAQSPHRV